MRARTLLVPVHSRSCHSRQQPFGRTRDPCTASSQAAALLQPLACDAGSFHCREVQVGKRYVGGTGLPNCVPCVGLVHADAPSAPATVVLHTRAAAAEGSRGSPAQRKYVVPLCTGVHVPRDTVRRRRSRSRATSVTRLWEALRQVIRISAIRRHGDERNRDCFGVM